MTTGDGIIGAMAGVFDRSVADPAARDAAKLALLSAENRQDLDRLVAQLSSIGEAAAADAWTRRARPTFLYVMYVLLLWSIPMGLLAAIEPSAARHIAAGMAAYLAAIPEPLYALFGTGYLGYTLARQWGKANGTDR